MKTQTELAIFLKITPGPVTDAKRRDVFPIEWALKISQHYNVSIDWILTGKEFFNRPLQKNKSGQEVNEEALKISRKASILQKKLQYILENGNLGQQKDIGRSIEELYDEIFLELE